MGENLAISVNAVLPLIICMAAGYLFRRIKLVDEGFCRKCNTFCFKTFLPLMIFMNVYNSDLESAVQPGAFLFAAAAVLVIFAAAFLIIPRIVKKGSVDSAGSPVSAASRQAVLIQCIFRSNFVIFGYQVVANVYGAGEAAVASVMAAIVVPLYNVLAVITLEYFTNSKNGLRPVILGIIKKPPDHRGGGGPFVQALRPHPPRAALHRPFGYGGHGDPSGAGGAGRDLPL